MPDQAWSVVYILLGSLSASKLLRDAKAVVSPDNK